MLKKIRVAAVLSFGVLVISLSYLQAHTEVIDQGCHSINTAEWLLGHWRSESKKQTVEESWTRSDRKSYSGTGSTRKAHSDRPPFVESLRIIEMSDDVFYLAKTPQNLLPVAFKLVECHSNYLRFENLEHDFPQTIEYRKVSPNQMFAKVSAKDTLGFKINFIRVVK